MRKAVVFIIFFIACLQLKVAAQQNYKRTLTASEVKILTHYSDSILKQIKKIHRKEIREQLPGKYQPQRIALVRDFLWLFEYFENQYPVVNFTSKNIINIIGLADKTFTEDGYLVMEYTAQNNPHLKLKNLRYTFVFKNNSLIMVKRY
jgi:hypothetical protein